MIRLSKLADYALVLMVLMARRPPNETHNARDLTEASRLPLPTVTKLLKLMQQRGLLISHRGVNGGYSLACDPAELSVAAIVAILEGEIATTACGAEKHDSCDIARWCPTKSNQRVLSRAIRGALEAVSLAELAHPLQLIPVQDGHGGLVNVVAPMESRKVH